MVFDKSFSKEQTSYTGLMQAIIGIKRISWYKNIEKRISICFANVLCQWITIRMLLDKQFKPKYRCITGIY